MFIGAIWTYEKINNRLGTVYDGHTLRSGLAELALTIALLSLGLFLLSVLRRRRSRYLPLAFGVIIPACILGLFSPATTRTPPTTQRSISDHSSSLY